MALLGFLVTNPVPGNIDYIYCLPGKSDTTREIVIQLG